MSLLQMEVSFQHQHQIIRNMRQFKSWKVTKTQQMNSIDDLTITIAICITRLEIEKDHLRGILRYPLKAIGHLLKVKAQDGIW